MGIRQDVVFIRLHTVYLFTSIVYYLVLLFNEYLETKTNWLDQLSKYHTALHVRTLHIKNDAKNIQIKYAR